MNSSSIMSPRTRIRFPTKEEMSWSARLRVSVMVLQKLFCCRDSLLDGNRLNAKRRRCNEATIARAWIALKWILNNGMVGRPWPPSRRIRRTPQSQNRRSHRCRQMHRTRIVADVEFRTADQLGKFRNAKTQKDLRRRQTFRHLGDRRFLSRSASENGRQSLVAQPTRKLPKLSGLPSFSLHQRGGMNHGIRTVQGSEQPGKRVGLAFVTQRGRRLFLNAQPLKRTQRSLDAV